ncbi:retinol-binding protein pinta [Chrysoperla carnea]|uniref:retinol-binding protein pinta n=1 Tax=Chrysoperla carnea TaxID=189513 RepID=UPI001D087C6F|nr:retinol-binding protein pinta [Chrysoperla carnea]XP_044743839.1 retinol-binding protein pinta [Chrysoperla carnea]
MYETNLSDADLEYLRQHFDETDESRERNVNEIRTWIEENGNFFLARTDYVWILSFLRGCKYDIEKTKKKIHSHLKLKESAPEWFQNRNPNLPELKELFKVGVFIPLRERDSENRLVCIVRAGAHNPYKHKQDNVFKISKMILEAAIQEMEAVTIYGVVVVVDMANVAMGHAIQLTPSRIKKAVTAWENYYVKPKQMNFIKAPSYINVILNVFKSFMSTKLKNRVHIYNDSVPLDTVVEKRILPKDYGGDGRNLQELQDYWHEKCLNLTEWFADDEKYKAFSK